MKALVTENNRLNLRLDMPEPTPIARELKIEVAYASLNPTDLDIVSGAYDLFLRLQGGLTPVRTGFEFSGTALSDGARFKTGDRVYGYTRVMTGPKTHQQVIYVPEELIAAMPLGSSFAEAAALPLGAQTSLVCLREAAKLEAGQSVLLNGATGGLGVFAIQIAKMMDLVVTAVAGPGGQETMKSLGADHVIDYREQSLAQIEGPFDAVLDLSTHYGFREVRHLLAPRGLFVPLDPMKNWRDFLGNPFRTQKAAFVLDDHGQHRLLEEITGHVEAGRLQIPEPTEFPVEAFERAAETVRKPGTIGRIVLRMS